MNFTDLFQQAQTIAVVGLSPNQWRDSYGVARYMQRAGYRIVPVNPKYEDILGEPCYPDLASIPADIRIDIVDIFRRPEHTAGVVAETAARAERTGERPVIWTQLGVSSFEAQSVAEQAGLPYVADRCLKVVHAQVA
ncbi:MAG: CoA-binding protein [Bacteroidota bacterium]